MLVLGKPRRRDVLLFGALPFLAFVPWIPELVRSMNDVGKTKINLPPTGLTVHLIRDAIVPLFFGEHGAAASAAFRGVQALVVIVVLVVACVWLWRTASRDAFWLLAGLMVVVLVLYLAAAVTATDIFRARYLTTVIPLAAGLLGGAVASLRWRVAVPAVGVVLAVLGVAIAVVRAGREYEPATPVAVAIAWDHGYRVILTNSSEVAFYGRKLRVILDRPFGMGLGENYCDHCAVIDDARFGGVRPGPGPRIAVGPIIVRFPPGNRVN